MEQISPQILMGATCNSEPVLIQINTEFTTKALS